MVTLNKGTLNGRTLMPSTLSLIAWSPELTFLPSLKDARSFLSHVTSCTLLRVACFLLGDFHRAIIVC